MPSARSTTPAAASLAVFSRPRTGEDSLPPGVGRALHVAPDERLSQSRRVELGTARGYLWPSTTGVCYLVPVGGGCMPLRRIERRGLDVAVLSQVDPATGRYERSRVFGIVRDGIRSVRLLLRGAGPVTVGVDDNAFYLPRLREPPLAVRWTDGRGVHAVRIARLTPHAIEALR